MNTHGRRISVTGLGYVGLPVAVAFARQAPVIGFDIDAARIDELRRGHDRTREVDAVTLRSVPLRLGADPLLLREADFHIVAVPTPVDEHKQPDLRPLHGACETIGAQLKRGDIVVFESTVFPGATEEVCAPILERRSGLRHGVDFHTGYSPERINPGDPAHRFESIVKVVAAADAAALGVIAAVYGSVVTAGVHLAPSIKVAETAKVLENTQRDLNIALMNELSRIAERLGIDTGDVLAAAATKWNFLPFAPGLVGGHCIGVDPYYLTHLAASIGYTPEVILAGRAINDGMGRHVAQRVCAMLGAAAGTPVVTVLGFTFKENIPDIRNSGVLDLVRGLEQGGCRVRVHDPLADRAQCRAAYEMELCDLEALEPADAVVLAVAHREYAAHGWPLVARLLRGGRGVVFDVKGLLDRAETPDGIVLARL
jgi:UDP-N-acetyl-D-galactosamine dehydrogenase